MGPEMKLFMQVASEILEIPTPVIEVGSVQIAEGVFGDLRPYFPKPYVGLDMGSGPGVDLVGSVENLPLRDESGGTLVSVATLEHVQNPIRAFDEMYRAIDKTGMIIVTSLFKFPIHAYPSDYWRFTPACFNLLLDRFYHRIVCSLGHSDNPIWVMGIGFKSGSEGDRTFYEELASSLFHTYLQKLSGLTTTSPRAELIKRVRRLPGFRKHRSLSLV